MMPLTTQMWIVGVVQVNGKIWQIEDVSLNKLKMFQPDFDVYFSWINLIHTPIKEKTKETPESSKWFYSSL